MYRAALVWWLWPGIATTGHSCSCDPSWQRSRHDRDLASQIRRANNSISLNLAEAFGTKKGTQRVQFETALGSLYETRHGVRLAVAWGYVGERETTAVLAHLHRLGGRIFGLMR